MNTQAYKNTAAFKIETFAQMLKMSAFFVQSLPDFDIEIARKFAKDYFAKTIYSQDDLRSFAFFNEYFSKNCMA